MTIDAKTNHATALLTTTTSPTATRYVKYVAKSSQTTRRRVNALSVARKATTLASKHASANVTMSGKDAQVQVI